MTHFTDVPPRKLINRAILFAVMAFVIYESPAWLWFLAAVTLCAFGGSGIPFAQ